jgi:hypothetical protein
LPAPLFVKTRMLTPVPSRGEGVEFSGRSHLTCRPGAFGYNGTSSEPHTASVSICSGDLWAVVAFWLSSRGSGGSPTTD